MASPVWSAGLSCVTLLVACEGQPESGMSDQPEAIAAMPSSGTGQGTAGVRLALLPPSRVTDMAALEGTLHADGPCLYIMGTDERPIRTLPAFHIPGLRWDPGTQTLRVGDAAYSNGQRVVLGGGYPPNPDELQWVQRPDPSCDASDLFVAGSINPASEERER